MNARMSPDCACCNNVFESAPAIKIDFFADAIIRPRNEESLSTKSRCSFNSSSVAASKMFAPESGRSNVRTQILSSPMSRRMIEAVATAGIAFILDRFGQMPRDENPKSQNPSSRQITKFQSPNALNGTYRSALIIDSLNLFGASNLGFGISPRLMRSFVALAKHECYKRDVVGKILEPEIRSMIDARNFAALREVFHEWPPADVAEVILDMPEDDQVIIFRVLPHALAADVFEYLDID